MLLCVCVCVIVYIIVCIHACTCLCVYCCTYVGWSVEERGQTWVSFHKYFSPCVSPPFLSLAWVGLSSRLYWLTNESTCLYMLPGITSTNYHLQVLNLGSHACKANTLLTEPFPKSIHLSALIKCLFKNFGNFHWVVCLQWLILRAFHIMDTSLLSDMNFLLVCGLLF